MSRFYGYIHTLALLPLLLSPGRVAAETITHGTLSVVDNQDDEEEDDEESAAMPTAGKADAKAEADAPADPAAPTPDYAPAFERLFALGLPDSRGGVFVKPEDTGRDYGFDHGNMTPSLPGFAWRMPAAGDAPADYIINGVARFSGTADAPGATFMITALFQNPTRFAPSVKIPKTQKFTDADLAKELAAAHKKLADWKRKIGDENIRYDMSERLAAYVILAAQASRHGHTEAANKLAHLAITSTKRSRAVAAATTSVIAEARWNKFLHTWSAAPAPDTKALEAELTAITTRFAQGWTRTRQAGILLERIRSSTTTVEPTLPGRTFTPEQLKFAKDLLALRTPPPLADWLAPANSPRGASRRYYGRGGSATDEKSPIIDFLRAQGPEALPLLAALADDNTITPCVPVADASSVSYHSPNYLQDDEDDGDSNPWRVQNAFSQWENRPRTRGEIARLLLSPLEGMNFESGNSDGYVARVLAAHETLKTEGRIGFFIRNTRSESSWERRSAWQSLIGFASDEADFPRIEQAMLESADKQTLFNDPLPQYLAKRAAKAAPFFQKFTEALRAEISELDDSQFSRKKDDDFSPPSEDGKPVNTREAALAALDAKIADLAPLVAVAEKLPPDKRLARMLDNLGKGPSGFARFNHEEFAETVTELGDPWTKAIPDILARAAKEADREEVVAMLLNTAGMATSFVPDDAPPVTPEIARSRFHALLPHWKTLLEKAAGKAESRYNLFNQIENLHPEIGAADRGDTNPFGMRRAIEPEEQLALLEARFAARIDGKPLPPWPNPSRVPAEKLAAIVAELAAIAPEKLAARYSALSADERLAWAVHVESHPKDVTPTLTRARTLVAAVKPAPGDAAAEALATELKLRDHLGRPFDAPVIRDLITRAVTQKPATAMMLYIEQRPYGLVVYTRSITDARFTARGDTADATPKLQAYYQRRYIDGDNGPKNTNANARFALGAASVDTAETKSFWKAVSTAAEPDEVTTTIRFNLSIPGPVKPAETPKD